MTTDPWNSESLCRRHRHLPRPAPTTTSPPTRRPRLERAQQRRADSSSASGRSAPSCGRASSPRASTASCTTRVTCCCPPSRRSTTAALADPAFRPQFRLRDWEDELLAIDPGFRDPSPTAARLVLRLRAASCCSPSSTPRRPPGPGYTDALAEVFYGLPVVAEFQRHYHAAAPGPARRPARPDSTRYSSGRGTRPTPPRIAILDWREVPTFSEFVLFDDYFRAQGSSACIVDPREVEYRDGKLMAGDLPHHADLQARADQRADRARRDGPPGRPGRARRGRLHGQPVPLQDPVQEGQPGGAVATSATRRCSRRTQQEAIAEHIPWTRVVEERQTTFDGSGDRPVPVRAGEQGPAGAEAERRLRRQGDRAGLDGGRRRWAGGGARRRWRSRTWCRSGSTLPSEPFPSFGDGRLQVIERMLDTDPFVAFGSVRATAA